MNLDQRFADAMGQLLGPDFPSDIGLAVSGGGDSMAMLTLAHNWARVWGVRLWVCTVDHGLRAEAAAEAAMVAEDCAALGHPHATLRWRWDGTGNKMDAARRARLDLIDRWRGALQHVLMAHTRDDLAETFLMRLARGSGADGLAAMNARRQVCLDTDRASPLDMDGTRPPDGGCPGFTVVRPCLAMRREELRHYLRTLKGRWVEDPSNDDPVYDRVRMRRLLELLGQEGIGTDRLADTALRLRDDRIALAARARDVWRECGEADHGILSLDPDWHGLVEVSTQRRLLSAALRFLSASDYAPRADALEDLRNRVVSGGGGTLHGVEVQHLRGRVMLFREYAAVSGLVTVAASDALWDGRWRVPDPAYHGLAVRALGPDGWAQVGEASDGALPHRAALSLPSLWDGDRLVACDALGVGAGGVFESMQPDADKVAFSGFLLSH